MVILDCEGTIKIAYGAYELSSSDLEPQKLSHRLTPAAGIRIFAPFAFLQPPRFLRRGNPPA